MSRKESTLVLIVGGPNDGEIVEYMGREMREAVPRPITGAMFAEPSALPLSDDFPEVRVYDLHYWSDKSGPTGGRRYVLREQAEGLGARS